MLDVNKINRQAYSAIVFSYLAVAAGLAGIAMVIFREAPEPALETGFFIRSEFFFARLIWAEMLIALFFGGGWLLPFFKVQENQKHIGGGYLVIANHIMLASIVSLAVLLLTIFIPNSAYKATYLNFHIGMQIVIAVVAALKISSVYFSMAGHQADVIPLSDSVKKPSDCVSMLKVAEADGNLTDIQRKTVKKIREQIKYSILENGKITTLAEYRQLVERIEKIIACIEDNKLAEFDESARLVENNITVLINKLKF